MNMNLVEEQILTKIFHRDVIQSVFNNFDNKTQLFLTMYYGLNCQSFSLNEISKRCKVSNYVIKRDIHKALNQFSWAFRITENENQKIDFKINLTPIPPLLKLFKQYLQNIRKKNLRLKQKQQQIQDKINNKFKTKSS
jgi:hypothetical protein